MSVKAWWQAKTGLFLPRIPDKIPSIEIATHLESVPPPGNLNSAISAAVENIRFELLTIGSSKTAFKEKIFRAYRPYIISAMEYFSKKWPLYFLWTEGVTSFPFEDVVAIAHNNIFHICISLNPLRGISKYEQRMHGSVFQGMVHMRYFLEYRIFYSLMCILCNSETEDKSFDGIRREISFAAYLLFPNDISSKNEIFFRITPTINAE